MKFKTDKNCSFFGKRHWSFFSEISTLRVIMMNKWKKNCLAVDSQQNIKNGNIQNKSFKIYENN